MKRIAICCDGTWNTLNAENVTNVVISAQAILPIGKKGRSNVPQTVYYDEGVGTSSTPIIGKLDKWFGGAFGWGLMKNVEQAYRYLVFNYQPGDEIYIFGFSRGAFTARSLAGLIRNCGIIKQEHAPAIGEAVKLYRDRDAHPDADESMEFRARLCPHLYLNDKELAWREKHRPDLPKPTQLTIDYIGVWDTVGAMGVPGHLMVAGLFNRKYAFHDAELSSSVKRARHAVAIDERRRTFAPALWKNLPTLNGRAEVDHYDDDNAHFQQKWFPGEHGGVGGGGYYRGHSHAALLWVLDGASKAGLNLEQTVLVDAQKLVDHRAPLNNMRKTKKFSFANLGRRKDRAGPQSEHDIFGSAKARWCESADNLPERDLYRPKGLMQHRKHLDDQCS